MTSPSEPSGTNPPKASQSPEDSAIGGPRVAATSPPPEVAQKAAPEQAPATHSKKLSPKAEQTRRKIVDTAIALVRERGYAGATMRLIAEAAGVSLGSAYYYFPSKEHLVQHFYTSLNEDYALEAGKLLEQPGRLADRLRDVLRTHVRLSMPYHQFAGVLFKTAADPDSPLSPFSEESQGAREQVTAVLAEVIRGSELKLAGELKEELPNLLWLYQMGIVLFWVHDRSPDCRRTHRLIDRTVDLIARLIKVSNLAPMRPIVRRTLLLVRDLRDDVAKA